MNHFSIRPASPEDAPALTAIYNHYIAETTITLETEIISAAEMEQRRAKICQQGWFFVIEIEGSVLGYAYAKPWHQRAGLRFTFESSIYLTPTRDEHSRGAGETLYRHLIKVLAQSGKVAVLLGVLSSENERSALFHQKLGFSRVAELQNVAFKFDRWVGLTFYQLDFSLPSPAPNIP